MALDERTPNAMIVGQAVSGAYNLGKLLYMVLLPYGQRGNVVPDYSMQKLEKNFEQKNN